MALPPSPSAAHEFTDLGAITQSPHDERAYKAIQLRNGLKCLLVSQKSLDKAGAALCVHVGSFSDPEPTMGVAHFLEHLLFMGTAKYPNEEEYTKYLAEHSGHSNAYTDSERTNYYFEVAADFLEPALDRFAQFFVSPLFAESCVDREMHAVDSEHQKNVQQDAWRIHQTFQSTSNAAHPIHKFGTGDLKTLKIEGIYNVIKKFYRDHYSASIMTCTVVGKESLDELAAMAVEKFSDVPTNDSVHVPSFAAFGSPFIPENFSSALLIRPVKDLHSLRVVWQLPELISGFEKQFGALMSHLFGHEGTGSILAHLKSKQYATGLSSYTQKRRDFSLFFVSVDLTVGGYTHYIEVVRVILAYLDLLQSDISRLSEQFKECADLAKIRFLFKESSSSSDFALYLADNLQEYPVKHVLDGDYFFDNFDALFIEKMLSQIKKDNFRLVLVGKELDNSIPVSVEPYYETQYQLKPYTEKERHSFNQTKHVSFNDLQIPTENVFIAKNFDVLGKKVSWNDVQKKPNNLIPNAFWHKLDDFYALPKAQLTLLLQPKKQFFYATKKLFVLSSLFLNCFDLQKAENYYDASVAGISYTLKLSQYGLECAVGGFNDSLNAFYGVFVRDLVSFEPSEVFFNISKEKLLKEAANKENDVPYLLALFWMRYSLIEPSYSHLDVVECLPAISFTEFKQFCRHIFSENTFNLRFLALGNLSEDKAQIFFDESCKSIPFELDPAFSPKIGLTAGVADGKTRLYRNIPNKNNCVDIFFKTGTISDSSARSFARLFDQIFRESFFNQLRTLEQLGYVCLLRFCEFHDAVGVRFLVQSSSHSCEHIESRIFAFLNETCSQAFAELTVSSFDEHKSSLKHNLLEEWKNLATESFVYWKEITCGFYDFEKNQSDAKFLENIFIDNMSHFYRDCILKNCSEGFYVSLWLIGSDFAQEQAALEGRICLGAQN